MSNFDGLNAHKNKEQRYLKLVISIQKKKKQFHLKNSTRKKSSGRYRNIATRYKRRRSKIKKEAALRN